MFFKHLEIGIEFKKVVFIRIRVKINCKDSLGDMLFLILRNKCC